MKREKERRPPILSRHYNGMGSQIELSKFVGKPLMVMGSVRVSVGREMMV